MPRGHVAILYYRGDQLTAFLNVPIAHQRKRGCLVRPMTRDAIIEDDRGDMLAESDGLRSSLLPFTSNY